MFDTNQIAQNAAYIVAAVGILAAAFERWQSSRKAVKGDAEQALLSDAKMFKERAAIMQETASANMILYVQEREQHQSTREYWHGKASEYQATLSGCQEKLQEYQAKPDFTDILRFIEQQSQTSVEILRGIREILVVIEKRVPEVNTSRHDASHAP